MNKAKRGVSVLISIIMILTILVTGFPSGLLTASATGETGMPDYTWYGDGSSAAYYISSADQLVGLENIVSGTNGQTQDNFINKTITLTGDIDLSVYGKGVSSFNSGKGWIPIGTYDGSFYGDFDGGNCAVLGLYINDVGGDYGDAGLFGDILFGTVKNLRVIDVEINGGNYIGGVVGYIASGAVVENCYVSGSLNGNEFIGGVIGSGSGSVENCYSECDVSGNESVGGLVGGIEGSVESCYATGDVSGECFTGGLIGHLKGNMENCYTKGDVSGELYTGGLVGFLDDSSVKNCVALNQNVGGNDDYTGRVAGSGSGTLEGNWAYADMDITIGGRDKAPLENDHEGIDGADIPMEEALTAAFWADTIGWDGDDVWLFSDGELPAFRLPHFTGLGTEQNPYIISTAEELAKLAELVNADKAKYNAAHYLLEKDIDLSCYDASNDLFNGGKGWLPIGTDGEPFQGVFDGGNHAVLGLYLNDVGGDYEDTGLFGDIFDGTVKNLRVIDVEINGSSYIGGVVGYIVGGTVVENCYVSGRINGNVLIGGVLGSGSGSVINCYSECDVSGNEGVGGLIGAIEGNVENSYATGDVSGESNIGGLIGKLYSGNVENCYTKSDVSGDHYIGGLVGNFDGGSAKNCLATGDVNGASYCIGGIAGIMSLGTIENCYAIGEISGKNAVGGITGNICDFSTVQNCVALNPSVTSNGDEGDAGRVAGVCSGTLANNWAYDDMEITMEGEDKDPLDKETDKIDGMDVKMEHALTATFWMDTMEWDDNVWSFADGKLPVLKKTIFITSHPMSIMIPEGSPGVLTVKTFIASDTAFAYQWYSNTTNSNSNGTAVDSAQNPTAANASFEIPTNLTEGTYYYYCEISADGTAPVYSNAATVTVTHAHNFGSKWESGEGSHWHECPCGEKNGTAAHNPGNWIIDSAATATANGSRHKECTICGYITAKEAIPAISMTPTKAQFTCSLNSKTYDGKAQGVNVTPKSGVGKVAAVYYNKSKTVPTNAGSYAVTVDVAAGTQYGAVTGLSLGTFTISKADLTKIKAVVADAVWTGKQIKPTKFTYNGINFSVSASTTVKSYGKNKDIGMGTLTLVGKGNFTGIKAITFKILPKKDSISKITVGKKQMKVNWKTSSAAQKITKYQIRYRVKGTAKWKTQSYSASASSAVIKNLIKGKKYELQMRSYKKVSGKLYYSEWSTKKSSGKIK